MVIVSGCAGSQGPETVEVTGTVTMDGNPVEGANVVFHPLEGGEGVLASQSVTNAEGQFQLTTHVGGGKYKPGIVAGKYAIVITKLDKAAISTTFAPPQNLLPKKYSNPATSGLTAEVVVGRPNEFEFPLEAN